MKIDATWLFVARLLSVDRMEKCNTVATVDQPSGFDEHCRGASGPCMMDPALLSALSAILGSLVGGSASVGAAWVTQKAHTTRELMTSEIRKRETLYGEFIVECSKLLVDAMDHTFDTPSKLLDVYAIENRIRLTSTTEVLVAAERTVVDLLRQYLEPTLTNDAIRERAMAYTRDYLAVEDPIKPFAEACRRELAALRELV